MKIRVQFFSRLREIGGDGMIEREIDPETTVGEALQSLEAEFPDLKKWEGKLLIAVGVEFAKTDQLLQPDDLISLMPPVQGG